MNLWIDDVREEPEGWAVARTYEDAARLLARFDYDVVSFDHDLSETGKTGYDLLCQIEAGNLRCPQEIRIHSMNPVGRQKMGVVARRLRP